MQLNPAEMEKVIYSVFRLPSTNDYKKTVINTVYSTIRSDSGITLNNLKRRLNSLFGFDDSDIDSAVALLTNPNIFGSVSRFEVEKFKHKKPVHLRSKASGTEFWKVWISDLPTDLETTKLSLRS
jgi:hypothetical protein